MKFAKLLERTRSLADAAWRPAWLQYKVRQIAAKPPPLWVGVIDAVEWFRAKELGCASSWNLDIDGLLLVSGAEETHSAHRAKPKRPVLGRAAGRSP